MQSIETHSCVLVLLRWPAKENAPNQSYFKMHEFIGDGPSYQLSLYGKRTSNEGRKNSETKD